jgi:hypothetical protein
MDDRRGRVMALGYLSIVIPNECEEPRTYANDTLWH